MQFSRSVYSLDAVKRAAYRMSGDATFDIVVDGDDIFVTVCEFDGKPKFDEARFKTEVLDADLRIRVAKETEEIRNTILSHVFSKSGLVEGE